MATTVNETAVKGILGTKIGMTQVWDADNRVVPVTAVQAGPCVVTAIRTPESDGYAAVQLGFGAIDPRKVTRPEKGHFAKAGVSPRRHVVEIRTGDAAEYELGQDITAEVFAVGERIDATATSKGKGFTGVMKGLRMAGRHGGERTTVQNLVVQAVDAEQGIILVRGAIPGPRGGLVLIRSAAKGA